MDQLLVLQTPFGRRSKILEQLLIQLHVSLIEAQRLEQINHANGEAAAMIAVAEARANGLTVIAKS